MAILVNGREALFTGQDLPILISGQEGSGASYFSICLIADFLRRGHKILFFSAFPAAKIEFMNQMSAADRDNSEFINNGDRMRGKRTIILDSGDEADILKEVKRIPDLEERIIFFKNMDKYSPAMLTALGGGRLLIISGDIDQCSFAADLAKKDFSTMIFFSQPSGYSLEDFKKLKKYQGVVKGVSHNGVIEVVDKPRIESLD